jgi:hypothetical protein
VIGQEQVAGNTRRDHLAKRHWNRIAKLPHCLTPRTVKFISIWKGLQTSRLTNAEISNSSVCSHEHVLAARNSVTAGLECLGRQVQRASGVPGVDPCASLQAVVQKDATTILMRTWQITNRVTYGSPG